MVIFTPSSVSPISEELVSMEVIFVLFCTVSIQISEELVSMEVSNTPFVRNFTLSYFRRTS